MSILVAYFSASGTTAAIAKELAGIVDAPLYEIRPEVPYTAKDLDWTNRHSRSSVEMNDKAFRPALAPGRPELDGVDTILLGFPIWWYVAPTIINSFLESVDLSGKRIVLFATSGGSGFGRTVKELQPSAPGARIEEGRLLNRASEKQLKDWVATL